MTLPAVAPGDVLVVTFDWSAVVAGSLDTPLFTLTLDAGFATDSGELSFDGSRTGSATPRAGAACLGRVSACGARGFSFRFDVRFGAFVENSYFLASAGVAMLYRFGRLQFAVYTETGVS